MSGTMKIKQQILSKTARLVPKKHSLMHFARNYTIILIISFNILRVSHYSLKPQTQP